MPKIIYQTCSQCGETLPRKDNFYKFTRQRRWYKKCKRCVSKNNKNKRDINAPTERTCRSCGEVKVISEFKSDHGRSYCLSCSSKGRHIERINDRVEDTCILCGEIKPRYQFKRLYKNGSKCISCVSNNKRVTKERRLQRRINSGEIASHSRCQQCKEDKSSDHFMRLEKSWNGLSYVCNECKEMNSKNKRIRIDKAKIERAKKKELSVIQKKHDRFTKKLDEILSLYPDCCIMNEKEYQGYIITKDFMIRSIDKSVTKKIRRSTEYLYFKYFGNGRTMDDYYIDFKLEKVVKFDDLSKHGRPSNNVDRGRKIKRDKKRKDPLFRLKNSITSSFCQWMSGKKAKSTWKYVDYTLEELKSHLESLFVEGMSWDNYGWDGWWVDHIVPRDSFDMNDPEQIKECWKLSNLQPLWAKDNMAKGNSVI